MHLYAWTSIGLSCAHAPVCMDLNCIELCACTCMHGPQLDLAVLMHLYAWISIGLSCAHASVCMDLNWIELCACTCMHGPQLDWAVRMHLYAWTSGFSCAHAHVCVYPNCTPIGRFPSYACTPIGLSCALAHVCVYRNSVELCTCSWPTGEVLCRTLVFSRISDIARLSLSPASVWIEQAETVRNAVIERIRFGTTSPWIRTHLARAIVQMAWMVRGYFVILLLVPAYVILLQYYLFGYICMYMFVLYPWISICLFRLRTKTISYINVSAARCMVCNWLSRLYVIIIDNY